MREQLDCLYYKETGTQNELINGAQIGNESTDVLMPRWQKEK